MPAATYLYPNITIFVEILFIIFGDGGFSGVLVEGGGISLGRVVYPGGSGGWVVFPGVWVVYSGVE